jgi:hypothetical protein
MMKPLSAHHQLEIIMIFGTSRKNIGKNHCVANEQSVGSLAKMDRQNGAGNQKKAAPAAQNATAYTAQ